MNSDDSDSEQNLLLLLGGIYGTTVLAPLVREPFNTSKLSGEQWTQEVLDCNNPRFFREEMRMERPVFDSLCQAFRKGGYLSDSRFVSVEQQVHMFTYMVTNSAVTRVTASRFQHSGETVNRYFNKVLNALDDMSSKYITLPTETEPSRDVSTPIEITSNPKFYLYFKDCIGAIDGSLIPVRITGDNVPAAAYRCRKGFMAQNILAVCSFDLTFQYVLAGWEGSANDSKVLEDALTKGFTMPTTGNKYYLADAGYGLTPHFLTPYRGVRYHLKEFAQGKQRPENAKELFNLRHASLRNAVERIFGVLKKRFPVLKTQCEYKLETQVRLVKALCCLHNYIRMHSLDGLDQFFDLALDEMDLENERLDYGSNGLSDQGRTIRPATRSERDLASKARDKIADQMWRDYIRYICNRDG
jgi:hypothetical protein